MTNLVSSILVLLSSPIIMHVYFSYMTVPRHRRVPGRSGPSAKSVRGWSPSASWPASSGSRKRFLGQSLRDSVTANISAAPVSEGSQAHALGTHQRRRATFAQRLLARPRGYTEPTPTSPIALLGVSRRRKSTSALRPERRKLSTGLAWSSSIMNLREPRQPGLSLGDVFRPSTGEATTAGSTRVLASLTLARHPPRRRFLPRRGLYRQRPHPLRAAPASAPRSSPRYAARRVPRRSLETAVRPAEWAITKPARMAEKPARRSRKLRRARRPHRKQAVRPPDRTIR